MTPPKQDSLALLSPRTSLRGLSKYACNASIAKTAMRVVTRAMLPRKDELLNSAEKISLTELHPILA